MSDWYGKARSNYFRVKDELKFTKWLGSMEESPGELNVDKDKEGRLCIICSTFFGGWPQFDSDGEPIDFAALLAPHLEENSIAVLQEIGAEKMRYLTGTAVALNAKGVTREVSICDIYKLAADLGGEVTKAEW